MFQKKMKNLLDKNIKTNIIKIQTNNSIMCGYFLHWIYWLMLAGKFLIDYTSLFSPYDFEKNVNVILSYFKNEWIQFHIMQFHWSN